MLNGLVEICGSHHAVTEVQSVGNLMEAILLRLLLNELHLFGRKKTQVYLDSNLVIMCVLYVAFGL